MQQKQAEAQETVSEVVLSIKGSLDPDPIEIAVPGDATVREAIQLALDHRPDEASEPEARAHIRQVQGSISAEVTHPKVQILDLGPDGDVKSVLSGEERVRDLAGARPVQTAHGTEQVQTTALEVMADARVGGPDRDAS